MQIVGNCSTHPIAGTVRGARLFTLGHIVTILAGRFVSSVDSKGVWFNVLVLLSLCEIYDVLQSVQLRIIKVDEW